MTRFNIMSLLEFDAESGSYTHTINLTFEQFSLCIMFPLLFFSFLFFLRFPANNWFNNSRGFTTTNSKTAGPEFVGLLAVCFYFFILPT